MMSLGKARKGTFRPRAFFRAFTDTGKEIYGGGCRSTKQEKNEWEIDLKSITDPEGEKKYQDLAARSANRRKINSNGR